MRMDALPEWVWIVVFAVIWTIMLGSLAVMVADWVK